MIVQLQSQADTLTSLGPTIKVNSQWGIARPIGEVFRQIIVQNNTTTISPGASFANQATMCVIIPPTTNAQQWQLKGSSGDVGIPMVANLPAIIGQPGNNGFAQLIGIGLSAGADQVFTIIWL